LRVAAGDVVDHSFLGVIYGADKDADWKDPNVWRAANPSLGTTITEDYLAEEVVRASVSPARQTTFRQLHLGVWTSEVQRWIDPDAWRACGEPHRERNKEGPVFAGLDLSSTTDISALVLLHPYPDGTYDIEPYFWMPEDGIAERERRDRLPYREWAAAGYMTLTPGNLIDYAFIEARIIELKDRYPRMSVAYDPWNATSLITRLLEQGVPCLPTRQGYATMSSPTKELERLVLAKGLRHNQHPVLETHVTAALCQSDPAGNVKPSKSASNARIDGCVATIMALNSATLSGSLDTYRSVYEERGIQTV
jgi:phage terminase large subunit-like protein